MNAYSTQSNVVFFESLKFCPPNCDNLLIRWTRVNEISKLKRTWTWKACRCVSARWEMRWKWKLVWSAVRLFCPLSSLSLPLSCLLSTKQHLQSIFINLFTRFKQSFFNPNYHQYFELLFIAFSAHKIILLKFFELAFFIIFQSAFCFFFWKNALSSNYLKYQTFIWKFGFILAKNCFGMKIWSFETFFAYFSSCSFPKFTFSRYSEFPTKHYKYEILSEKSRFVIICLFALIAIFALHE